MKFLILTSSFRKKGNTAQLVSLLENSIRSFASKFQEPIETQTINLAYRNIQLCHGCRVCFDKGETCCPYWDDIAEIKTAMQTADGIILASPVYVEDINGVMKNWIDRLAHVCHRPEFGGKVAYLLTTSGTGTSGHALRTMASALRTWGFHIIGQSNFITGASMTENELNARFQSHLNRIALQIVSSIKRQKAQTPSFISLIFFKVQQVGWQNNTEKSIDYDYWQSKGWTNPHTTFYFPHAANWLKVISARVLGSIISRLFV